MMKGYSELNLHLVLYDFNDTDEERGLEPSQHVGFLGSCAVGQELVGLEGIVKTLRIQEL